MVCAPGDPAQMAEAIRRLSLLPQEARESMGARGREAFLSYYSIACGAENFERTLSQLVSQDGFSEGNGAIR